MMHKGSWGRIQIEELRGISEAGKGVTNRIGKRQGEGMVIQLVTGFWCRKIRVEDGWRRQVRWQVGRCGKRKQMGMKRIGRTWVGIGGSGGKAANGQLGRAEI